MRIDRLSRIVQYVERRCCEQDAKSVVGEGDGAEKRVSCFENQMNAAESAQIDSVLRLSSCFVGEY